jgi:hypothetical protein
MRRMLMMEHLFLTRSKAIQVKIHLETIKMKRKAIIPIFIAFVSGIILNTIIERIFARADVSDLTTIELNTLYVQKFIFLNLSPLLISLILFFVLKRFLSIKVSLIYAVALLTILLIVTKILGIS